MQRVALILLAALGCSSSTRYRVPLRGNPHVAEANLCYDRCSARGHGDAFFDCLRTCPGTQVAQDNTCSAADAPPRARCAARSELDPSTGLTAFGVGLLVVLDMVVIGLWAGDD